MMPLRATLITKAWAGRELGRPDQAAAVGAERHVHGHHSKKLKRSPQPRLAGSDSDDRQPETQTILSSQLTRSRRFSHSSTAAQLLAGHPRFPDDPLMQPPRRPPFPLSAV
jgi:hypothetical protein